MQNSSNDLPAPLPALQWDDVRHFLAVIRGGSLSAAARALGVQHSTVARRVDALEATLGVRLFDRLPRGWPPTDEGRRLAVLAARIEEEASAFERAARGASALDGTVRVSAPPVFASHFLAPRLAGALRAWPRVTVDLIGEMRAANLYSREADLAVRLSRPEAPGLAARRLGTMRFALYATPDWAARPEPEWEFVGYDDALADTPQQQWLARFAGARRFAFVANDLAALHRACAAGAGVALLPGFLGAQASLPAAAQMPAPALVPLGPPCDIAREIWLVVHPDVRRSPRVRAVADAIAQAVSDADGIT